jgi:hypothetical protein
MGRMKETLLKESEGARSEIEDLIGQAEEEIGKLGKIGPELMYELSLSFVAYGTFWPADDMSEFGRALIEAIKRGEAEYIFTHMGEFFPQPTG